MKKILIICFPLILFFSCNNNDDPVPVSNPGIFAIGEIGYESHWMNTKYDKSQVDFAVYGDTMLLGGIGVDASTIADGQLVVFTNRGLKTIDITAGVIIKSSDIGNILYGLEFSAHDGFIYAMSLINGSQANKLSRLNIETNETVTISDKIVQLVSGRYPSTISGDGIHYYFLGKDTDGQKIFSFDTRNGQLVSEVSLTTDFPRQRRDGLSFNRNDGLLYFLELKEDGDWKLKSFNPETFTIGLFLDNIPLLYELTAILLDNQSQTYMIQNVNSDTIRLTTIDLSTKQFSHSPNSARAVEMNLVE